MTTAIIIVFVIGYILIAMEGVTKISKTAVALLMSVLCWVLYNWGFGATPEGAEVFAKSLGETCEIIFFLMGAMVIVEVVDTYGGFNFVRRKLHSKSKRSLLWKMIIFTFFLSAVLDNLTTSIVMIMVLRKLVDARRERLYYASMVILAANSGGAFSPIGDVTTIMLWVQGNISTLGVLKGLIVPSLMSVVVPGLIVTALLKGDLVTLQENEAEPANRQELVTRIEKKIVFAIGVGGLLFVPIFRQLTGLPPFMGILLVLSVLWIATEIIFYRNHSGEHSRLKDVTELLHKIDMSTILFFLGILTAVSALNETGTLKSLGVYLDDTFSGNPYIVTGIIGLLSSVVDNVPLVASCMGMYDLVPLEAATPELMNYVVDGTFWELLAYCAGVGGSILIIGSAAGVVVMGLEKISFGWYLKHITPLALAGYLSGIGAYWLMHIVM